MELCLFPPVRAYSGIRLEFVGEADSIALGHMIAIAGAWACVVWLWNHRVAASIFGRIRFRIAKISYWFIGIITPGLIAFVLIALMTGDFQRASLGFASFSGLAALIAFGIFLQGVAARDAGRKP